LEDHAGEQGGRPVADLTTIDGLQFHFDPNAVTAVADHDENTLEAVTTVYGLMDGRLRIAEDAQGFLARMGVARSFAKLTRLNDTFIWVNGSAVAVIRSPLPDEYPLAAQAVVLVGTLTQAVKETLAQVKQALNSCGGKL
jgi:hypothetical protein